jgi:hypothetical protein
MASLGIYWVDPWPIQVRPLDSFYLTGEAGSTGRDRAWLLSLRGSIRRTSKGVPGSTHPSAAKQSPEMVLILQITESILAENPCPNNRYRYSFGQLKKASRRTEAALRMLD